VHGMQSQGSVPGARAAVLGRRVLVVDDNVDGAATLGALLELGGHDTRIAHSALDALSIAKGFRPHVALIDIRLLGMNGYDLVSLLRAQKELDGCRYIAVTACSGAPALARSMAARFEAHFTKPVSAAALLAAIAGNLPSFPLSDSWRH